MNFKPGAAMYTTIPLWINGKEVYTSISEPLLSPSTSEILHHYSSASVEDCLEAVKAAEAAFKTWSKTTVAQRRDILLKASDILRERADLAADWSEAWYTETGEKLDPTLHPIAAPASAEICRDTAGRIAGAMCGISPLPMDPSRTALVSKEPYGVCFAMTPWNVPHILAIRACVFAIATGSTVVLRGSELSPKCTWQIGKLFKDAGLPDGVLNIVHSRRQEAAETVQRIIEHPAVRHINFTGSAQVGRIVASIAGRMLKPCLMELGGKASSIVLEDADLGLAARECASAAFLNGGQVCMSTERILVHESVTKEFVKLLGASVQAHSSKDGVVLSTTVGVQKSRKLVSDAVKQGASILHGSIDTPRKPGLRMIPVVLGGVTKDMDLHYAESFGPQVSIYTFKEDAEAVKVANDTEYGLTAAVFSKDLGRAIGIARQIESGAVHINSSTFSDDPSFPHGGVKDSGFGRFNAQFGLDAFLKYKTISWTS